MKLTQHIEGSTLTISLEGRLESNTILELEVVVQTRLTNISHLILDLEELVYLSSAGLRTLLKAQKVMAKQGDMVVRNANPTIMEIFGVTGFVDILTIEQPQLYKEINLDNGKIIGQGANGTIYQHKEDSIVKLYHNSNALEEIEYEKQYAREALILGIPTAISLGIVKVGSEYGLEYEFIQSHSMSGEITAHPEKLQTCVDDLVSLARMLHTTPYEMRGRKSILRSAKELYQYHISINPFLGDAEKALCHNYFEAIPNQDTLIHGDFHTGNIMIGDEGPLLIDIADICYGHPIFDLAGTYFTLHTIINLATRKHPDDLTVIGLSPQHSETTWNGFINQYLSKITTPDNYEHIIDQIVFFSHVRHICLCTLHKRHISDRAREQLAILIRESILPHIQERTGEIDW